MGLRSSMERKGTQPEAGPIHNPLTISSCRQTVRWSLHYLLLFEWHREVVRPLALQRGHRHPKLGSR
jgi:hypothetical protein